MRTLAELAFQAAARYPNRPVLRRIHADGFIDMSGQELLEQVRDLTLGLIDGGLSEGDRVALLAENRPEWCVADLAVQTAGAITVPVYPTLTSEQILYLLKDCGATLAVVSNRAGLDKIVAIRPRAPRLATTIVMDADGQPWPERSSSTPSA